MKKTAILSILLSLCMVVTLLSGVSAFAATVDCGTVADMDGYEIPVSSGYQNYHFTATEAGTVTMTAGGYMSLENYTTGNNIQLWQGETGSIDVAEGDIVRVQTYDNEVVFTLSVVFTPAAGGDQGGEEEEIDTTVLEGTYEAGYASLGMPDMWVLTFNNGILSIQDNNNGNYTGSYDYSVDADGMITISGGDGTMGVIGTPGNYTFFCGGCPGGVAMVKTANASSGEEGGDEPSDEPETLDGTYEAQFYGTTMYQLVFNAGTLTVTKVGSISGDVSGTYAYIVVDGLPVADCGLFSKDTGGNLTFQPEGFATPMTLVKTSNDVGGGEGGEPVDPPATTEPITVWGPYDMNDQYTNGSIAAGQTQEYLIYQISQGTLEITGNNLTVVFNGETYTTSRWNTTISISVSEEDMTNPDEYGGSYAALSVSSAQGANYTVKFVFPEGSMDNAVELDNLLKVPTTLLSDGSYYYTWTADFTGELTLYMNQGIEGTVVDIIIHNEDYSTFANLVTYDDNDNAVAADSLTIEVEEGVTYTINIQEYADADGNVHGGTIIFSNREELTATGTSDDPFTLEEGEMELVMEAEKSYDGLFYTYTATANGVLTVTVQNWVEDCKLLLSGMTNQGNGVYTIEVEAGETYTINPWMSDKSACDLDMVVSFQDAASIPGSSENPEVLDTDATDLDLTFTGAAGHYYTWTAPADGKVTFALDANNPWMMGETITINGESLTNYATSTTIEVKAGDVVTMICKDNSGGTSTIMLDVTFEEASEGGDVPSAGDYTFLVFALMAMSMTALVVLVSKKRAF